MNTTSTKTTKERSARHPEASKLEDVAMRLLVTKQALALVLDARQADAVADREATLTAAVAVINEAMADLFDSARELDRGGR